MLSMVKALLIWVNGILVGVMTLLTACLAVFMFADEKDHQGTKKLRDDIHNLKL